jgi:hypothetical protein
MYTVDRAGPELRKTVSPRTLPRACVRARSIRHVAFPAGSIARTQARKAPPPLDWDCAALEPDPEAQVTESEIHLPARIRSQPRVVVPRTVLPRLSVVTTRCERPGPERTFATRTQTRRVCTTFDVEASDRSGVPATTPRDGAVDATAPANPAAGDAGLADKGLDSALEDSAVEDSALEDRALEDSALEDAALDAPDVDDPEVDGTDRATAMAAAQQEPRSRRRREWSCEWACA